MKRMALVACCIAATALGGCVAATKKDLSRELAMQCASYGDDIRVRIKEPELKGGVLGSVVGSGECLRPGDEGYEEAMTVDQYLASLGKRDEG